MKKKAKAIVKQKSMESRLDDLEERLELLEHQFKNMSRFVLENSKESQVSQLGELSKGLQELQSILGQLGAK